MTLQLWICMMYSFMNIQICGMDGKRNHVPCKDITEDFLRVEYAKFVEELPEAYLYSYPDVYSDKMSRPIRNRRHVDEMVPCLTTKSQRHTPCKTKMLMNYDENRYPHIIPEAQCCAYKRRSRKCEIGIHPKHVLFIKKEKDSTDMCIIKRKIQLISVRCYWPYRNKSRRVKRPRSRS